MQLDMRTLWMVIVISYALLGGFQLMLWQLQRQETAMLYWGLSHFCCGIGGALITLRGVAPDWLSIGIGNVFTATGYLMTTVGLLRFAHRPVRWHWIWPAPLIVGWLFITLPFFAQNTGPRVVLMAALLTVCCAINLLISWRAQQREPLRLRQVAMMAFATSLLFSVIRAAITVLDDSPAGFMDPSNTQPVLMLIGLAILLFFNISMMLMPAERLQNQLRRAAQDDALTHLLNRGGFNTQARRLLEQSRQLLQPVSLLLMDLDHFKRVNDNYGHETGDRVLYEFAETLRSQSRATDLIARYGGEEFCVLLPDADHHAAMGIAERIRQQFTLARVSAKGETLASTVSIGLVEIAATETLESALQRADEVLYLAKRDGRNRVMTGFVAATSSA